MNYSLLAEQFNPPVWWIVAMLGCSVVLVILLVVACTCDLK